MNSEDLTQDTAGDGAPVAERPGCVTAYAVLLFVGGGGGLLMPLMYAFGPSSSMFTTQDLIVMSMSSVILAAFMIATAVGLWRLKRWAVGLVLVELVHGLANTLYGMATVAAAYRGSALLTAGLSTLFSFVLLSWFVRNRALFQASPRDRGIVIGGALVLVVVFVMGIL